MKHWRPFNRLRPLGVTGGLIILGGMTVVADVQFGLHPVDVFGGRESRLQVAVTNSGASTVEHTISARILQTSSSTAVPVAVIAWEPLRVEANQTANKELKFSFPAVRHNTKFLIQWIDASERKVLGTSTLQVYPENVLAEIAPIVPPGKSVGMVGYDVAGESFRKLGVDVRDHSSDSDGPGNSALLIVGPDASGLFDPNALIHLIKQHAKAGIPVVWIVPKDADSSAVSPSFYPVDIENSVVVVAQVELVSDLPDNPRAQAHLVHFCRMAMNPKPFQLPVQK